MSLKNRYKVYIIVILCAVLLMILLCGCSQISSLYSKASHVLGKNSSSDIEQNFSSLGKIEIQPQDEITHPIEEDNKQSENDYQKTDDVIENKDDENPDISDDPSASEINDIPDPPDPGEKDDDPDDTRPEDAKPYGLVSEGERVEDEYFDDAVFIGDSISVMLQYYTMAMRAENESFLGKAFFLCSASFGFRHAVLPVSDTSFLPVYAGEKRTLEDSISLSGAKKIYIMLGMNDISGKRYTATIEDVDTLVTKIREKTPDAVFYFQSVTPRMCDSQTSMLNNEMIREFDNRLCTYCEENGHYYIDVYEAVCNDDKDLRTEYCGDPISEGGKGMGIHFTYSGCEAWTEYLYTHTA